MFWNLKYVLLRLRSSDRLVDSRLGKVLRSRQTYILILANKETPNYNSIEMLLMTGWTVILMSHLSFSSETDFVSLRLFLRLDID